MNYVWDRPTLPEDPVFPFLYGSKAADAEPSPYKPGVRNESCNPILSKKMSNVLATNWKPRQVYDIKYDPASWYGVL